MRVLFVAAGYLPGSRGGTEVHAHALASALVRQGHEVSVFCREGDPGRPDYATRSWELDGIPVTAVNYNFGDAATFAAIHRNPRIEELFVRHLEEARPDVVHVHHLTCLSTGILDRVAERGVTLVMTLHDFWMVCARGQRIRKELELCEDLEREKCAPCLRALWPHYDITADGLRALDRELRARLRACDALISPSAFHGERMLEFGLDRGRLHVVPHGLPRPPARPRRLRDRVRTIGYVGSVMPTKGVHILVEAFNRLARPELRLRVHGEAPVFHGDAGFLDRLRAMPHAGLDVAFTGPYEPERVWDLLEEIDLLVVPGLWWEAFCLTIREGFLAGVPVVASGLGAMGEAFEDGRGGVHVRPGDPADLHRVLVELVDDPARYRALAASIPAVRPIDDCARETASVYEAAAKEREARAHARSAALPARNGTPHATVFIPTWNGGPLFERVLDKVLAQQTSFDYEVLVIDSGSKDGTVEAVRRRPRVRLIEIPNSEFNHGLTRNRAVQEARGEIVALLTQDAEPLDESWLQRLVANFADPKVAGAYCHQLPRPDCNPFQRDRLRGWTKDAGPPEVKELPDPARLARMHPFERYRLIAFDDVASCVRKSVMLAIPFEKRQFGEDVAWAKQAILAGWKIVNDPGAVVIHSHDSPVLYEFRRVFLDHQNIHDLVGLHTIPKWWMVPLFSVKALFHLTAAVWRDDRGVLYRLWWTLKTPLYAFTQNLAQYLGARSVAWKREGRHEWFDRRMRKGI
jgi:rhamnosyltransferase